MSQIPDTLAYTAEHEWVRVDGDVAVIGITDFAQDSLGDVVFVQLPEVGVTVAAAATVCEVESTKSVSDIYSPVSGEVVEANAALDAAPELVNADPYGEGWIFKVRLSDPTELEGLLAPEAYAALTEG